MAPKSASSKFSKIYDSLPPDAQRVLVHDHLMPLLDLVPKERSHKASSAATRLQKKFVGIPVLDLKAKQSEINDLLEELARDAKRSFIKDRGNREELISEIVDSLVDWLNDIWSVVYEYRTNFSLAHNCLLFAAHVLDNLANARGGCKCSFINMFVAVTIKDKSGKVVKSFSLTGANNIDGVLLWIWRELFVSLLDTRNSHEQKRIPDMLADIQTSMNWRSLQGLLFGGTKSEYDDEDYEEECYQYLDDEEDASERCTCHYHASHWSDRIDRRRFRLRDLVQERLTATFKTSPSLRLYASILSIAAEDSGLEGKLCDILASTATSCSESFAAALDIHAAEGNTSNIVTLLDSHYHLLRPRDAPSLQSAAAALADNPLFLPRALQIVEKELVDTARAVHDALLVSFKSMDDEVHKQDMQQILKLRTGSTPREHRVERWVDAVVTPGTNPANPIAFAAMMMGMPIPPGMEDGDDADAFGFLDMDQNDPDLDDLREEFRPRMKDRFEGWTDTAEGMRGGPTVLMKAYRQIIELMPFFAARDVVEEMTVRIQDKASKHHVCDAMDAILAFTKQQRKKLTKQKAAAQNASSAASSSTSPPPTAGPSSSQTSTPPWFGPPGDTQGFSFSFAVNGSPFSPNNNRGPNNSMTGFFGSGGGMEDVD